MLLLVLLREDVHAGLHLDDGHGAVDSVLDQLVGVDLGFAW
jgi:hypothetical protein